MSRLNLITLSVTLGLLSMPAIVNSADVEWRINPKKVKSSKWKCEYCLDVDGWKGQFDFSVGSLDAKPGSGNFIASKDDTVTSITGTANYFNDDNYLYIDLADLGLENRKARIKVGQWSNYQVSVDYREMFTDKGQGKTPFNSSGELPDNFNVRSVIPETAMLYQSYDQIKEREQLNIKLTKWLFDKDWKTQLTYRNEVMSGRETEVEAIGLSTTYIPFERDYRHQQINAAISYYLDKGKIGLQYFVSSFSNENEINSWQNPYSPIYGGAVSGEDVLPDNKFYKLMLDASYGFDKTWFTGKLAKGEMQQDVVDVAYTTAMSLPNVANVPVLEERKVETEDIYLRLKNRSIDSLSLTLNYSANNRTNKTDPVAFQPVKFDFLVGPIVSNTPISNDKSKTTFQAKWTPFYGLSGELGISNKEDNRTYQQRSDTDLTENWLLFKYNTWQGFDIELKHLDSVRTGSHYNYLDFTAQNSLLKKYYLADRDRQQSSIEININAVEDLSFSGRYKESDDDYSHSELGLQQVTEQSTEWTVNWTVDENINVSAYSIRQKYTSEQLGQQRNTTIFWRETGKDIVDSAGITLSFDKMMNKTFSAQIDYGYNFSRGDNSVEQSQQISYLPQIKVFTQYLSGYIRYRYSPVLSFKLDARMQEHFDTDWHWANENITGLYNVLTDGQSNLDYVSRYVGLSVGYSF